MREYTIVLDPDSAGDGYTVRVPALPGCITEGSSRDEAAANAQEAIALYLESLIADGEPVPDDIPAPAYEVLKVAV